MPFLVNNYIKFRWDIKYIPVHLHGPSHDQEDHQLDEIPVKYMNLWMLR